MFIINFINSINNMILFFQAFESTAYEEVRRAADVLYTMIKSKVCSLFFDSFFCFLTFDFLMLVLCCQSAVRSEFLNKLIDQLDKSVDVRQYYPKTNRLFPASARMLSYPAFIAYFVSVLPFEHDEPINVLMSINRSVGARASDIETVHFCLSI
jgi:hypothetical protein